VEKRHYKLGTFHRVADNLYSYSVTKKYYAVFKSHGKTRWVSLKTTDRELAGRRLKEQFTTHRNTDPKAGTMTLTELFALYEQSIQGFAKKTQGTRKSILKTFRSTWKHGLDLQVRAVTRGQLGIWLSEQRPRLKNSSFNEYTRFVRQLFEVALAHQAIDRAAVQPDCVDRPPKGHTGVPSPVFCGRNLEGPPVRAE
jgi:hypothetical protein